MKEFFSATTSSLLAPFLPLHLILTGRCFGAAAIHQNVARRNRLIIGTGAGIERSSKFGMNQPARGQAAHIFVSEARRPQMPSAIGPHALKLSVRSGASSA